MDSEDNQAEALADEIQRYLLGHPDAADTVEGIRTWWLARQRLKESLILKQRALDLLEYRGVIAKRKIGPRTVYRLAIADRKNG
jgi:hypothetical protein